MGSKVNSSFFILQSKVVAVLNLSSAATFLSPEIFINYSIYMLDIYRYMTYNPFIVNRKEYCYE